MVVNYINWELDVIFLRVRPVVFWIDRNICRDYVRVLLDLLWLINIDSLLFIAQLMLGFFIGSNSA